MSVAGFFRGVDQLLQEINALFAQPANSYCRLETADGDETLVADDGSFVSMLELSGTLRMVGKEEFGALISSLSTALTPLLKSGGHVVQVVVSYDPEAVRDEVDAATRGTRVTAKNLGLAVDELLDDWNRAVAEFCALEKVLLVLWTRPNVLPPSELKLARKKMGKSISQGPPVTVRAQSVGKLVLGIRDAHHGFVSGVETVFREQEYLVRRLDAHEAVWHVRHAVDPAWTSRKWRPLLPGDPFPLLEREAGTPERDLSDLLYPNLRRQVFPREAEILGRQCLRVGDLMHAPLVMTLPPQQVKPFNSLFQALVAKRIPWRASFLLEPFGLEFGWKASVSSVFGFASTVNQKFNQAVKELRARDLDGETVIRFRATFDTWIGADEADAHASLRRRSAELSSAVQAWGASETSEIVGDPLLGFSASVPGLMPTSPAPCASAPISEALCMLPVTRTASPWREGSMLLRTPDGKLMPYAHNSSLQTSWVELGVAPMGGGKSVHMNTSNFAFLLQAGLARLPWLSIIDIGPSSKGLIVLLQQMLPPERRHLAAYHRLRMEPGYSINPFDTPLGCRKPNPMHRSFLVNLLSLFATPLDQPAPSKGVPGLAMACIDTAYDLFSDKGSPRPYTRNIDPLVDEAIENLPGFEVDRNTTWWEVVDALFLSGRIHEATRAQRYAVPLLGEVAARAREEKIANLYADDAGGLPVSDFFWRSCMEAIQAYPILGQPTKFDLGDAQVVSLDLDEVAPRGGAQADRQTGVMYLLARHICASRFFLMPEDVADMPLIYQEHHRKRIDAIRQDPKRLCYDELHRVARNDAVSSQVVAEIQTCIRESRKWLLGLAMYSQDIGDFPDVIVELASTIYVLGSGTEKTVAQIVERFALNQAARTAMKRLGKPGRRGANMVALVRTKHGNSILHLTNTIGPMMLWAFSTTTEDVHIRNRLYERVGALPALRALARRFPGGAKEEVERRRMAIGDADLDATVDIIPAIVEELAEQVRTDS